MIADRAHPHAARAHRDDLVVEVGEAPPMLGDQPRETSPPDPAGSSAAPSSSPSERPWARSRRSDWQVSSRAQEPRRPRPARPPDARPARRSRCAPRAPSPGRPAARRARTPHPAHLPRGAGPERPSQWPCDDPPRSIIMSSHTGALTVPREGSLPNTMSHPWRHQGHIERPDTRPIERPPEPPKITLDKQGASTHGRSCRDDLAGLATLVADDGDAAPGRDRQQHRATPPDHVALRLWRQRERLRR